MGTADVSYVPGVLTAVAGDQFWALIEAAPDSPAVTRVWRQVGRRASADVLLAGLIADGAGGTPAFALLTAEDGGRYRLFCRGTVSATVGPATAGDTQPAAATGDDGRPARARVDGAGLLTWREQLVVNPERVFLGEPPAGTAVRLPAMSGVFLASCVTVDLTAGPLADGPAPDLVIPATRPAAAARAGEPAGPAAPVLEPTAMFPDTITITPPGATRPDVPALIDAPPWRSGTGPGLPGPALPGPRLPGPALPGPGLPGPALPGPGLPGPDPGESGATVKRAGLTELADGAVPPDRIGPLVPALVCPEGHVCPPTGAFCRRCGAPLPSDPVPVSRPVLGVLRLSLGDVITLDRSVLMGRNPRTDFDDAAGAERPHVVKLPSADGDISRTHLRVSLDGWHVLVTDLGSTNGTLVTLPGRDPQQIRPGEPVLIQPGTLVVLAEGIDFRYEATE